MVAATTRKATAADAERVRAIARAAYAKYVARMGREPPPMLADFPALIAGGVVVVIDSAGVLCGYMAAWPEADIYLIDNLAVDPAQQGKGFGRLLVEHAIDEARRLKLPAVWLYTNVAMTENLAIYRRLGFAETHRAVEHSLHRVYMRLTL